LEKAAQDMAFEATAIPFMKRDTKDQLYTPVFG